MTPQGHVDAITLILFAGIMLGLALMLTGCMPGIVTIDTGR